MATRRLIVAQMLIALLTSTDALGGCAKFSCLKTDTGRCHFVVFGHQDIKLRFELARAERRWISGVDQGDTYCATLRNQPGETCPVRKIQDIKPACPPALVSMR
jgi:hypothetical protein